MKNTMLGTTPYCEFFWIPSREILVTLLVDGVFIHYLFDWNNLNVPVLHSLCSLCPGSAAPWRAARPPGHTGLNIGPNLVTPGSPASGGSPGPPLWYVCCRVVRPFFGGYLGVSNNRPSPTCQIRWVTEPGLGPGNILLGSIYWALMGLRYYSFNYYEKGVNQVPLN